MLPLSTRQLTDLVQGTLVRGNLQQNVTGISIDNRTVQPGDLFVAFVGVKTDGHQYIADAFEKGAVAALVTHDPDVDRSFAGGAVIRVTDPLQAITRLAVHERTRFGGPVVAVTGSNGKTTTKDMLKAVFSAKGPCLATAANYNNELGLPLTLLGRTEQHQSIVLEMGMRGLGQIAHLCDVAKPTAGTITNIGQSHIELLGSQENIAIAKGELLEALPRDGVAVLSKDDAWLQKMSGRTRAKVLWYSVKEQPATTAPGEPSIDAYATDFQQSMAGVSFTAHVLGQSCPVQLPTHGRHNVGNALGALLLGAAHAISLESMAKALSHLESTSGRLQVKQGLHGRTLIDDTYNASPLSMKASLSALMDLAQGRPTVAILGEMYELGDFATTGHREVGEAVAALGVQQLITIGPMAATIADAARAGGCHAVTHFADKAAALQGIPSLLPTEAVVLVKASRGLALEDVVRQLVSPPAGA